MILSTAALRKRRLSKLDVKSAFLQTGDAERKVYSMPHSSQATAGAVHSFFSTRRTA